jgi:hypothetical protein
MIWGLPCRSWGLPCSTWGLPCSTSYILQAYVVDSWMANLLGPGSLQSVLRYPPRHSLWSAWGIHYLVACGLQSVQSCEFPIAEPRKGFVHQYVYMIIHTWLCLVMYVYGYMSKAWPCACICAYACRVLNWAVYGTWMLHLTADFRGYCGAHRYGRWHAVPVPCLSRLGDMETFRLERCKFPPLNYSIVITFHSPLGATHMYRPSDYCSLLDHLDHLDLVKA